MPKTEACSAGTMLNVSLFQGWGRNGDWSNCVMTYHTQSLSQQVLRQSVSNHNISPWGVVFVHYCLGNVAVWLQWTFVWPGVKSQTSWNSPLSADRSQLFCLRALRSCRSKRSSIASLIGNHCVIVSVVTINIITNTKCPFQSILWSCHLLSHKNFVF